MRINDAACGKHSMASYLQYTVFAEKKVTEDHREISSAKGYC